MKKNYFYKQNLISTKDLTLNDVELILSVTEQLKKRPTSNALSGKIIANCFFEPSTRTRLSFEAAALRLGANVIGFDDDSNTSVKKGESLKDTIHVISQYADLITIRHAREGAAALAAEVAHCPVINAGDGANQHPTQALLDLYTIKECQGTINGLSIALIGDLKYGRAIHSFVQLCSLYDLRLYFVAPESLQIPDSLCNLLKHNNVRFSLHRSIDEVINKVDILYLTRLQKERFLSVDHPNFDNNCTLTASMLSKVKPTMKILHPLPRINEISTDIDDTVHAHYFQQAKNGVYLRQALLTLILNESLS